jgi:hypothetical protein
VPNIYAIGDVLHVSWFLFHRISMGVKKEMKIHF